MRSIETLLHILSDKEIELVSSMKLIGKQEAVVSAIVLGRQKKQEVNLASLGLTETHVGQICSVLLQKIYKVLAPNGIEQLCNFLIEKELGKLLYQQLHHVEKSGEETKTQEAKERFYEIAFESSLRVPVTEIDMLAVDHYANLYLASKKIQSEHDHLLTDMRKLRAEIRIAASGKKNPNAKNAVILRKLAHVGSILIKADLPAVCCQYHIAFAEYYMLLHRNPQHVISHTKEAMKYVDALPPHMARRERIILIAQLGNGEYMLGNFEEAFRLATELDKIHPAPQFLSRSSYYSIRYSEVAAILGKFDTAEQILSENFAHSFRGNENVISVMVAIRYAVIYLLLGRYDEAKKYIDLGFGINAGKVYSLDSDIILRFLEAAYHFYIKDWAFTATLLERSAQFLRRHDIKMNDSSIGFHFTFINAVMLKREVGTPIPPAIMKKYELYSQGEQRFFGMVLEKILERV